MLQSKTYLFFNNFDRISTTWMQNDVHECGNLNEAKGHEPLKKLGHLVHDTNWKKKGLITNLIPPLNLWMLIRLKWKPVGMIGSNWLGLLSSWVSTEYLAYIDLNNIQNWHKVARGISTQAVTYLGDVECWILVLTQKLEGTIKKALWWNCWATVPVPVASIVFKITNWCHILKYSSSYPF